MKRICFSATALMSLCLVPLSAVSAQATADKAGSTHVQCDGQPNNVTGAETAARLLGAVTLLGLFAPPRETADSSKRKFGAAGVAACTILITGERQEGNPDRRFGLILARSLHHIENKDYTAALADVALTRSDPQTLALTADPYFARSRGRAVDLVESAALLRMGRADEARTAGLQGVEAIEYSMFGLTDTRTYEDLIAAPSAAEDQVNHWRSRLLPFLTASRANRLELAGRFADAARIRDAIIEFDAEHTPELNSSAAIALSAVTHALAGNLAVAAERSNAARTNAAKRKADGKPETDAAEFVELTDLYNIVQTAAAGDMKTARRLFAARSQWVGASFGSVLEVNRRLRQGAARDEMIGGLAQDSDQLWKEHAETNRTELLAKDSDNKTLFRLIPSVRLAGGYEALSNNVWRTDKSRILLKTKADPGKSRFELMYLPMIDPALAMDAYVLHAALLAKSRGHQGFVFMPLLSEKIFAGSFRSGNRGEKGFPGDLFFDASDVIMKLSAVIPDPAILKQRRAKQ